MVKLGGMCLCTTFRSSPHTAKLVLTAPLLPLISVQPAPPGPAGFSAESRWAHWSPFNTVTHRASTQGQVSAKDVKTVFSSCLCLLYMDKLMSGWDKKSPHILTANQGQSKGWKLISKLLAQYIHLSEPPAWKVWSSIIALM